MIHASNSVIKSIVLVCIVLHSTHLMDEESVPPKGQKYLPDGYADYTRPDGSFVFGRWRNEDPVNENNLFENLRDDVSLELDFKKTKSKWNEKEW